MSTGAATDGARSSSASEATRSASARPARHAESFADCRAARRVRHRQQRDRRAALRGAAGRRRCRADARASRRSSCPMAKAHKDWPTLQRIFDALLRPSADRSTTIFALGGGVDRRPGRLRRGLLHARRPFVQVPTTLLAQVDSSVGGKTGINHPLGKNLIGAFHQPRAGASPTSTRSRRCPSANWWPGWPRSSSTAPSPMTPSWTGSNRICRARWRATRPRCRMPCSARARSRRAVVAADEREAGLRAILNFGHTFGHAIETGTGYGSLAARRGGRLRHGDGGRPVGAARPDRRAAGRPHRAVIAAAGPAAAARRRSASSATSS